MRDLAGSAECMCPIRKLSAPCSNFRLEHVRQFAGADRSVREREDLLSSQPKRGAAPRALIMPVRLCVSCASL